MNGESASMRKISPPVWVAGLTLLLTLASFGIVIDNAGTEPFTSFRANDVLVQGGLSCVLLLLWLQLAAGIVIGVWSRRISPWFVMILLWGCFLCYGICFCIFGYIQDIQCFAHVRTGLQE